MATMMDLNDDLLVEIFSKLPAGSIPISKSVCKLWYTLLSDPSLRTGFPQTMSGMYIDLTFNILWMASRRNIPLSGVKYPVTFALTEQKKKLDADNNLNKVTLDYLPIDHQSDETFRIVHVSDGLLLCNYRETLFVTNPITRTHEFLPPIPEGKLKVEKIVMGFDRRNDDNNYVVLAILHPRTRPIHLAYVFSRRNREWIPFDCEHQQGKRRTVRRERHPLASPYFPISVCYINGVFYFFQTRKFPLKHFIAAVDVNRGLLREIELPLDINNRDLRSYSLGKKSEGSLVFGGFRLVREEPGVIDRSRWLDVWMMEDIDGQNWELKLSFNTENFSLPLIPDIEPYILISLFKVVGFDPDFEVVFLETAVGHLFACSMRSKKITEICRGLELYQKFFVYTPLLVDIFANPIKGL